MVSYRPGPPPYRPGGDLDIRRPPPLSRSLEFDRNLRCWPRGDRDRDRLQGQKVISLIFWSLR